MPVITLLGFNYQKVATIFALSIEAGLSVVVGIFIGYYADKYFHTLPWLTLVFTCLGFIASVVRLIEIGKIVGSDKK
ncbi:MAG: AtpZ/AtpI family protein [Deltaproteobacteria bacterium]|nr:AtpZ/AtpI family protein [Deltaproteobacteria bacterium]